MVDLIICQAAYLEVLAYFAEDPKTPSDEFFRSWSNFITAFEKVVMMIRLQQIEVTDIDDIMNRHAKTLERQRRTRLLLRRRQRLQRRRRKS